MKGRTGGPSRSGLRLAAGLVAMLVLGVMASGALADGDPFSPLNALISSSSTTTSTSSDTTGASTSTADTTTDSTTTAETTTEAATTTASTSTTTTTTTPVGAPVPYIVSFADGVSDAVQRAEIMAAGGTPGDATPVLSIYALTFPSTTAAAGLAALRANSNVLSIDADLPRDTADTPNDAQYSDQWSLPRIGWDQVYGTVNPGGTATVAVLDTGVDASHPDLAGVVVPGKNIISGSGDGQSDPNGHGTAMAGIVAAKTNNGIGIAGVGYAGVRVMPVTVLNASGLGTDSDVINGVVYASQNGADVILMSFSNPGYSASLQKALDYAWSRGVVLVAATGNDASSTVNYPAGDRGVVGVSNTDLSDSLNPSSNYGQGTFLAAPGTGISTTTAGGGYASVTGTSAAAAEVAGAAALLRATSVGASNGVIVNRLAESADAAGTVDQTGNGRLNLARAISDTSSTSIKPAGAAPVGGGGPFVGPYVATGNKVDQYVWQNLAPTGFITNTLASTKNNYGDSDVIPARVVLKGLAPNTNWVVTVRYDFSNGTKRFIDSLATYNQTVAITAADACSGIANCSGSGTPSAIPTDTALPAGAQIPGDFTVFNGSITNTGAACTGGANYNTDGAGVRELTICGTTTSFSGARDLVVAVGLHLARENEWGFANGASSYPGASGKWYLRDFTGSTGTDNGGNQSINLNTPPGQPRQADLAITKSDSPDPVDRGGTLTYTMVVTNNGPTRATSAAVTDTFPASLSSVTWTCAITTDAMPPGNACAAASGSGNINTTVTLNAGAAATFTVTSTVSATATGTISNTANVGTSGQTNTPLAWTDPTTGNNSATATTAVHTADLAITKADSPDPVNAGSTLNYTINVTNNGPHAVTGAAVTDNFPASLSSISWTCTITVGTGSCTAASGTGNIATTVNLNNNATAQFLVTATVSTSATGTISNTASATVPATTFDPTTPNTATATTAVNSVGSAQGVKYGDTNGNGDKDGSEAGPGVSFNIAIYKDNGTAGKLDGADTFVATAATNATSGAWSQSNLVVGNYIVCEVQQTGWFQSEPTPTSGSSAVCGNPVTGTASGGGYAITISAGATTTVGDFGNYQQGTVSGVKFEDPNADGNLADGTVPAGPNAWTIRAYTNAPTPVLVSSTSTNTTSGAYSLTLNPGSYLICEVLQSNWFQSAPAGNTCANASGAANGGYAVVVNSGSSAANKDFGNYQQGTVSGTKWEDKNANGVRNVGDGPLGGWNIYVDYDNSSSKGAGEPDATTAADGTYTIPGVKPGTWTLREVSQTGWTCSYPSPCSQQVTLTSGGSVSEKDFGNWTTGSVTGIKFQDQNATGTQDSGENGLPGWTIKAYRDASGNGQVDAGETTVGGTATTGSGGAYTLNLDPGAYVICEVAQTNWVQTAPANVKCQSAAGAAPGGYAVVVTSSSSVSGKDFGNVGFSSGSTMTDSAFKLVDDLAPWTITDFEILLNPSNTIVATNPGQFYYHQRATNTSGATASMDYTINWPCQFTTQTVGGQPIHAYVQYATDPANTWRDFTPQSTNITWANSPLVSCDKNSSAGPLGTGTIRVNNVPAGAKVWVTVHLDYALKGTTASSNKFGNPPILYTPFQSAIAVAGGSSFSSTSLLGRGKKVTVVYGTLTDSSGTPMPNVWIRLTQGTNTAIARTAAADGTYVIYDGQACDDGLEGCTGASATAWTFGNGNASSKIDILGDGAAPAAFAAYPGSHTKAWVKTGTTYSTSPTFTSPTPPSYTFTVAKNSAYNRDWKFSP